MKANCNPLSLAALSIILLFSLPLVARAQTLINGANQTGTIYSNTVADSYTFTANTGDSINVRLGTTGFKGTLQLYGPNLALLATSGDNNYDQLVTNRASTNGIFTVQVSAYFTGGTGTYVLNLSQIPEAFIVPAGDGGGTLTNGANATGTITLGRQDLWTFTANTGDSINLRLGTSNFSGWIELYGPSGVPLANIGNNKDNLIAYKATNSGTFTVLVSDYFNPGADDNGGGTGTYVLNLSQIPEAFIVPAGDGGGTLTNGANATGTITLGRQDLWSFTANTGDSINVRLGSTGFGGWIELYGPSGVPLASVGNNKDNLIAYKATNSGTFTVLVSDYINPGADDNGGGTGTYVLNLSQIPEAFIVPVGDGGGTLTNGANATGTITLGRQDLWSFTANAGDSINVRLGSTGFPGWIELYGPNGALLGTVGNSVDNLIAYKATNSGTFTVLVSDYINPGADDPGGGTGTYVLNLSQIPEAFIVPAGDGGGPLTNGANATGTIMLGRQDLWTFTANKGDSINLRVGSTGFGGYLELYGPNGAQVGTAGYNTDNLITYTATTNGTFTALVSDYINPGADDPGGGSGSYVLNLSQIPETFIVPAGDGGGPLTKGAHATGTITLGREDMWAFTACTGDAIDVGLRSTNFNSYLELYGPNGALLASDGDSMNFGIAYTATNCGTFTLLVSAFFSGGTGTYGFTNNGLSYELKECLPKISGTNFSFQEVGGSSNANAGFVLYSSTNLATPFGLWTPILTNQFNQLGVFGYTNTDNPAQRQQFFRFVVP